MAPTDADLRLVLNEHITVSVLPLDMHQLIGKAKATDYMKILALGTQLKSIYVSFAFSFSPSGYIIGR